MYTHWMTTFRGRKATASSTRGVAAAEGVGTPGTPGAGWGAAADAGASGSASSGLGLLVPKAGGAEGPSAAPAAVFWIVTGRSGSLGIHTAAAEAPAGSGSLASWASEVGRAGLAGRASASVGAGSVSVGRRRGDGDRAGAGAEPAGGMGTDGLLLATGWLVLLVRFMGRGGDGTRKGKATCSSTCMQVETHGP